MLKSSGFYCIVCGQNNLHPPTVHDELHATAPSQDISSSRGLSTLAHHVSRIPEHQPISRLQKIVWISRLPSKGSQSSGCSQVYVTL